MQSTIPGILIVINSFFYCIPAFFANINIIMNKQKNLYKSLENPPNLTIQYHEKRSEIRNSFDINRTSVSLNLNSQIFKKSCVQINHQ